MNEKENNPNPFRTLKGFEIAENSRITHAMEDYLEMICRYTNIDGHTRINFIAQQLGVKPSSASKMVNNLKQLGLVEFEKYGIIQPTKTGKALGDYLLNRHQILHRFFCVLNQTENELEQTEKIEHFINQQTLENLYQLTNFLEQSHWHQK